MGGKNLEERGTEGSEINPGMAKSKGEKERVEGTPPNYYLSWFRRNLVAKRNEVPNHVPRQGASPR